jgi:NAD+ synthase
MTSGYLAEDLFLKKSFVDDILKKTTEIINTTAATVLVLPTVILNKDKLYNGAIVAQNRKIIATSYKSILPNYGIFDEKRYFSSGYPAVININGTMVGIPICEDIWFPEVCRDLKNQGASLFLVPNSSPYSAEKMESRIKIVKARYEETAIPILYCNQVTAHDGIVFDGRSFTYDGKLKIIGASFSPTCQMVEFKDGLFLPTKTFEFFPSKEEEIYAAMVVATREYITQNGFDSVVIGLSGGIDSALVAAISVDAIGAKNVKPVMMRTIYTSMESTEDAHDLAKRLGLDLVDVDITETVNALISTVVPSDIDQQYASITVQNIQSRSRGVILMAISNNENRLLLTTGNKSEYATGYATLYGDMNGAFNPIKDLYKTEVYNIVNYRNNNVPQAIDNCLNNINIIPDRIIQKSPSAELSTNQKDSDSLPEYDLLDRILELYIEKDYGRDDIIKQNFLPEIVDKVLHLVKISEFKRKQSAVGVKISSRSFDKERRYPISNGYKK